MSKIRIKVEWAYAIMKIYWKLAVKYLCLVLQQIRVTYLISIFVHAIGEILSVTLFCLHLFLQQLKSI